MLVRAAGHYYQRVHDLSPSNHNVETDPDLKVTRNYYELPYRVYGWPKTVAVVGAGSGNDVAAALRREGEHLDAIEIDPGRKTGRLAAACRRTAKAKHRIYANQRALVARLRLGRT